MLGGGQSARAYARAWTTTRPARATRQRQASSCSSPRGTLRPGTPRRWRCSGNAGAAVDRVGETFGKSHCLLLSCMACKLPLLLCINHQKQCSVWTRSEVHGSQCICKRHKRQAHVLSVTVYFDQQSQDTRIAHMAPAQQTTATCCNCKCLHKRCALITAAHQIEPLYSTPDSSRTHSTLLSICDRHSPLIHTAALWTHTCLAHISPAMGTPSGMLGCARHSIIFTLAHSGVIAGPDSTPSARATLPLRRPAASQGATVPQV